MRRNLIAATISASVKTNVICSYCVGEREGRLIKFRKGSNASLVGCSLVGSDARLYKEQ